MPLAGWFLLRGICCFVLDFFLTIVVEWNALRHHIAEMFTQCKAAMKVPGERLLTVGIYRWKINTCHACVLLNIIQHVIIQLATLNQNYRYKWSQNTPFVRSIFQETMQTFVLKTCLQSLQWWLSQLNHSSFDTTCFRAF